MYSAVIEVFIERFCVATTNTGRRGPFPILGESVDLFEPRDPMLGKGLHEMFEHATATYCGELIWVTNRDNPPVMDLGQTGELRPVRGSDHPSFIDKQCRSRG